VEKVSDPSDRDAAPAQDDGQKQSGDQDDQPSRHLRRIVHPDLTPAVLRGRAQVLNDSHLGGDLNGLGLIL
jgi:hypothetical protein